MTKKGNSRSINENFKNKDILSLIQFSPKDLRYLFSLSSKIKKIKNPNKLLNILKGEIITLLFYEPSSRTYASFVSAIKRLGGQTIDILDPRHSSSVSKGETLRDTIKIFATYSSIIILRHPEAGSAKIAAESTNTPIINAGDGIGEHPTQALLDLFTIYEKFGKLNSLTGVLAGDLLNGRTVHSLIAGLSKFSGNKLYLLSPKTLQLKQSDLLSFKNQGIELICINSKKEIPQNANFWYWTRIQKERFKSDAEYKKVKNKFIVNKKLLNNYAGRNTIIMHPLPRVGEIKEEVDKDQRAIYFTDQIKNGVYVRMALLILILNKKT
ncbi:aspartate carbamoyltransferase [Patescibacteria group bacterium]|nr:aspartate carbamoyltransferase [Patescibacteria group bacterium]